MISPIWGSRARRTCLVLVEDIDRGGVIASLVGTKAVIDPLRRRDDPRLSRQQIPQGSHAVRRRHGDDRWHDRMAALDLVPFFPDARLLPAEDALALDAARAAKPKARIKIAVPILPHVANFDDLDPLDAEPGVDLVRVGRVYACPAMPISWCCSAPARDRRPRGIARGRLHRHQRACAPRRQRSGTVRRLSDARARNPRSAGARRAGRHRRGLGLLNVETTLAADKRLEPAHGGDGIPFSGYEMHMGVTEGPDRARSFACWPTSEGAISPDGRVIGTYIHGLFVDDLGALGLADALPRVGPPSGTTRWSTKRRIGWRRILPPISISTYCSSCRDEGNGKHGDERNPGYRQPDGRVQAQAGYRLRRRRAPSPMSASSTRTPP